jgi:hypothetical protein
LKKIYGKFLRLARDERRNNGTARERRKEMVGGIHLYFYSYKVAEFIYSK